MQFVNCSPEQFKADLLEGIDQKLAVFKKHLKEQTPEEYLTRNEVSKMLKIDLSTLWSWSKKGKLKSYGIQGRVYYKRAEVEAALTELK